MDLAAIQSELRAAGLDGWLFCDFHHRDLMAYRILGLQPDPVHLGGSYTDLLGRHHEFSKVLGSAFELSHLPNRAELRLAPAGKVVGYTLSRIVDEFGAVSGAVLYFKDLTRVEQLEERERLKDRLAALGEMAAGLTPGQKVEPRVAGAEGYDFRHATLASALAALLS